MRELKADNLIGRDWRELADEMNSSYLVRRSRFRLRSWAEGQPERVKI
jgi:hypothetical protein